MLSVIKNTLWFLVVEIDETVGAVVPVAEYSSSSLKEMTVRLKQEIRKMNNPFFIFTSIPKVKYYWLRIPIYTINRFVLQCVGDFTWRVSDCEEFWWCVQGVEPRTLEIAYYAHARQKTCLLCWKYCWNQ